MSVSHQGREIDLRVATLPTVWARRSSPDPRQLQHADGPGRLGFSQENYERFRASCSSPTG